MTEPHRATPEQWADVEERAADCQGGPSCLMELTHRLAAAEQRIAVLELRSDPKAAAEQRISKLKANRSAAVVKDSLTAQSAPAGSLVDTVTEAIVDGLVTSDQQAARAAILAVADWFTKREWHVTAAALRMEAERHG